MTTELPPLPEPDGFRTRYRSEPGMIGHYPWTYADHSRRKYDRPGCEYEDLITVEKARAYAAAAVAAERAAERERCAKLCENVANTYATPSVFAPEHFAMWCAAAIRGQDQKGQG